MQVVAVTRAVKSTFLQLLRRRLASTCPDAAVPRPVEKLLVALGRRARRRRPFLKSRIERFTRRDVFTSRVPSSEFDQEVDGGV